MKETSNTKEIIAFLEEIKFLLNVAPSRKLYQTIKRRKVVKEAIYVDK